MGNGNFRRLICVALPVVLFGLLSGYIAWFSVFEYPHHDYNPDFQGASWISTGQDTPGGYFAKVIFIPEQVADAWINIAATDNVDLYVNGKIIATDTFVSVNVSGVHDLSDQLRLGKNVIAAYVNRRSYPGKPRLLLKGGYTDQSGRRNGFASDATWVTSSIEEVQGMDNRAWYSLTFNYSGWAKAFVEGAATAFPVYRSPVAPHILGEPLSGYWIWHPAASAKSAYFTKSFMLQSPVKDGVLGIAASSSYDLTVNGIPAAGKQRYTGDLDIYNITPLLHSGENTLGIWVKSLETTPGLFVDGVISSGDDVIRVKGDATWRTAINMLLQGDATAVKSDAWNVPVQIVKYPLPPWGILAKKVRTIDIPWTFTVIKLLPFISFAALSVCIVLCLWGIMAFVFSRLSRSSYQNSLLIDGILHIPPVLFLLFIYILKYDINHEIAFPFQLSHVFIAFILLFSLRAAALLGMTIAHAPAAEPHRKEKIRDIIFALLVISLIIPGFFIRLDKLDYASLSHDEVGMMQFTEGLFKEGIPFKTIGPYKKLLTTYELIPYSISLPTLLLGVNDYAARLHSVLWGTLGILLLYMLGTALFNRSTGLLAALIYTFHPWCINWSQNIFYPQMTQTLTILTVLLFYKAITQKPMDKKFLLLSAISFSAMYLSWEGSGFILIGMFLAILMLRGTDISWLREKHLWAGLGIILMTVFLQQSRRILYQNPYLVVGSSIADIGLPTLFFLDPMYSPYVYLDLFFFTENNWILTVAMLAGIFFLNKEKPLRFLYAILIGTVFFMTNFLSVSSNRYVYYLEPFLILIGSALIFISVSALKKLFSQESRIISISAGIAAAAMAVLLFVSSNGLFMKLYTLSINTEAPGTFVRQGVYWNDYKGTNKYVLEHMKEGDIVFAMNSHTLKYYTGIKGDYSLNSMFGRTALYDISRNYPGFLDKFMGNPSITSLDAFKNIVGRYRRIWFVAAPISTLTGNDRAIVDYIRKNFRPVFESYNTKVYLKEN